MTDEVMKRVPENAPDWTLPEDIEVEGGKAKGLPRRTILMGAAWSVPVISAAIATPLAAASITPTLEFVGGPYTADACGNTAVTVRMTTNGTTPAPGEPVQISLPAGFTWSDGTTAPRTFTTAADGTVTVTGLSVPPTNGQLQFTATSGTLTAATPITVSGATGSIKNFAGNVTLPAIPTGVTVVEIQSGVQGANGLQQLVSFLGSDGNVYRANSFNGGGTFGPWAVSPAFPGATTLITASNDATGITWATDGTTVKNFAGTTLPALPAGVTVKQIDATTGSGGTDFIQVLGSDGNVYRSTGLNGTYSAWTKSPSFSNTTKILAVSEDASAVTLVSDGTSIKYFNNSATLPALPAGAQIVDIQVTTAADGTITVIARGAGGFVYRTTGSGPNFAPWQTSTAYPGAATAIDINNNSTDYAWVTNGTAVKNFGGTLTTPALPGGVRIVDLQTTNVNGTNFLQVRGSDGNVYRTSSNATTGTFPAWTKSTSFDGTATDFYVNNDQNMNTWIAGGLC
ncbi:hypothetical protein [Microbacterium sp.]|uniref:hypothetical protein n=1 Tax=Microbacterium sp. TaxID=51671 RepID=UPI003A8DDDD9